MYTNILKPIYVNAIGCNLSDHNLIHCSVNFGFQISDDVQKCYSVCDYGKFNVCIRESFIYSQDVSVDTNNFLACISNAIESSTVFKYEYIMLKRKMTPWVNGILCKLIAYKKKLLKLRKVYPENECIKNQL